jgi:hypothetical protein
VNFAMNALSELCCCELHVVVGTGTPATKRWTDVSAWLPDGGDDRQRASLGSQSTP